MHGAQKSKKKKRPRDLNALALSIVAEVVGDQKPEQTSEKNQVTVEMERFGGLTSGKARAERITPEERSEIARKSSLVSAHFMYYDFDRIHQKLRVTLAIEAGIGDHV